MDRSIVTIKDLQLELKSYRKQIIFLVFLNFSPFIISILAAITNTDSTRNHVLIVVGIIISIVFFVLTNAYAKVFIHSQVDRLEREVSNKISSVKAYSNIFKSYGGLFKIMPEMSREEFTDIINNYTVLHQPLYDFYEHMRQVAGASIFDLHSTVTLLLMKRSLFSDFEIKRLEDLYIQSKGKKIQFNIDDLIANSRIRDFTQLRIFMDILNNWGTNVNLGDVVNEIVLRIAGDELTLKQISNDLRFYFD